MTDEQRERLKRFYRERIAQMPEGAARGPLLDILLRLTYLQTPRNIHQIHRARNDARGGNANAPAMKREEEEDMGQKKRR